MIASPFHWCLSVARGGAAGCSIASLFHGCLSVRGARRRGRLPVEPGAGLLVRPFIPAELAPGGQGHEDAAPELARAWGVADAKKPAPRAATEDACRAVAGRVARGRRGWDRSPDPFGRWHIRGRGWTWAESRINITYSQRSPRYVQGGTM